MENANERSIGVDNDEHLDMDSAEDDSSNDERELEESLANSDADDYYSRTTMIFPNWRDMKNYHKRSLNYSTL